MYVSTYVYTDSRTYVRKCVGMYVCMYAYTLCTFIYVRPTYNIIIIYYIDIDAYINVLFDTKHIICNICVGIL